MRVLSSLTLLLVLSTAFAQEAVPAQAAETVDNATEAVPAVAEAAEASTEAVVATEGAETAETNEAAETGEAAEATETVESSETAETAEPAAASEEDSSEASEEAETAAPAEAAAPAAVAAAAAAAASDNGAEYHISDLKQGVTEAVGGLQSADGTAQDLTPENRAKLIEDLTPSCQKFVHESISTVNALTSLQIDEVTEEEARDIRRKISYIFRIL